MPIADATIPTRASLTGSATINGVAGRALRDAAATAAHTDAATRSTTSSCTPPTAATMLAAATRPSQIDLTAVRDRRSNAWTTIAITAAFTAASTALTSGIAPNRVYPHASS